MPLDCEVILDPGISCEAAPLLAELLRHAARDEPMLAGAQWQMTLRLCDDPTIAELHAEFFNDPTPTDVITFPSGDEPVAGEAYLGDVVVSIETAAEQAVEAGHSTARECAFLALHGLLHLTGYDDLTDAERETMHRRQRELLEAWEQEHGRPW